MPGLAPATEDVLFTAYFVVVGLSVPATAVVLGVARRSGPARAARIAGSTLVVVTGFAILVGGLASGDPAGVAVGVGGAVAAFCVAPLLVGRVVLSALFDVTPPVATLATLATWPPALVVSLLVYFGPLVVGASALAAVSGTLGTVAWAVFALVVLGGPAALASAVVRRQTVRRLSTE